MSRNVGWKDVAFGSSVALSGVDGEDAAMNLRQSITYSLSSVATKTMNNEISSERSLQNTPEFSSPSHSGAYKNWLKFMQDAVIAAALLLFLSPLLMVITGCVVAFGGPGTPLFRHRRIGKDGRPFACLKIRTMRSNADAVLNDRLSSDTEALAEWTATQKLRNDPRIYPFGRFLRATSLDELPQLWNVIRGDMALVGPRPVTEDEMRRWYEPYGVAEAYRSVRPGITGLWQVSGRNDTTYNERLKLDRQYVETLSLWQDVRILCRTFTAVIRGEGAR